MNATDPILELQAARLFPLDAYLRREWMRAVSVVRSTTNGWVLDRKVPRATP